MMEEKSADELFAELGYKKVEDSRENSNCMYISFRRHLMFSTIIKIVFHYEAKRVTVENEFMSMQELQAINKKSHLAVKLGGTHTFRRKSYCLFTLYVLS